MKSLCASALSCVLILSVIASVAGLLHGHVRWLWSRKKLSSAETVVEIETALLLRPNASHKRSRSPSVCALRIAGGSPCPPRCPFSQQFKTESKLLANHQSYVAEQRRLIKGAVYLLLFALSHGISLPFQSSSVSPSASFRTGEKHRSSSDYSSDGKKQKTEDKDLASTRYVS